MSVFWERWQWPFLQHLVFRHAVDEEGTLFHVGCALDHDESVVVDPWGMGVVGHEDMVSRANDLMLDPVVPDDFHGVSLCVI